MNRNLLGWVHFFVGIGAGLLLWMLTFSKAIPLLTIGAYWIAVGRPKFDAISKSTVPGLSVFFLSLYFYGACLLVLAAPQSALELTHGRFVSWAMVWNRLQRESRGIQKATLYQNRSIFLRYPEGLSWVLAPGAQLHYRVSQSRKFQSSIAKFRGTTDLNCLLVLTIVDQQDGQVFGKLSIQEYSDTTRRDNGDAVDIDSTKKMFRAFGSTDPEYVKNLEKVCTKTYPFQFSADGVDVECLCGDGNGSYDERMILDEVQGMFPLIFMVLAEGEIKSGRSWSFEDQVDEFDDLPMQLTSTIQKISKDGNVQVEVGIDGSGQRDFDPNKRGMAAKTHRKGTFRFNATYRCLEQVTLHDSQAWALAKDSGELNMSAEIDTQIELVKTAYMKPEVNVKSQKVDLPKLTNRRLSTPKKESQSTE